MRTSADVLRNPAGGETVTIVRRPATGEGELAMTIDLVMPGAGPPPHAHPLQTERFLVTDGVLRLTVADRTADLRPGDRAEVPPGAVHHWTPLAVGTRMEVAVTPALRFEAMLEHAFALADAGAVGPAGVRDPAAVDAFVRRFAGEYRLVLPAAAVPA